MALLSFIRTDDKVREPSNVDSPLKESTDADDEGSTLDSEIAKQQDEAERFEEIVEGLHDSDEEQDLTLEGSLTLSSVLSSSSTSGTCSSKFLARLLCSTNGGCCIITT
jgi:hypothetical protein